MPHATVVHDLEDPDMQPFTGYARSGWCWHAGYANTMTHVLKHIIQGPVLRPARVDLIPHALVPDVG